MGIAGVYEQIALFQERDQRLYDRVRRGPGRHQDDDRARTAQEGHEFFRVARTCHGQTFTLLFQQGQFFRSSVIAGRGETVPGYIQQKVAAHHTQPDHPYLAVFYHFVLSAPLTISSASVKMRLRCSSLLKLSA